jgi:hypothetical protein
VGLVARLRTRRRFVRVDPSAGTCGDERSTRLRRTNALRANRPAPVSVIAPSFFWVFKGGGARIRRVQCHRATSLSIRLRADHPNAIGPVLGHLAQSGVRIDGNATAGNTLRLLTPDVRAARDVVSALGLDAQEAEVVVIDVPEETGAIARVLQDVAAAGLPITFMYLVTQGRMVISAPDLDGVLAVLARDA